MSDETDITDLFPAAGEALEAPPPEETVVDDFWHRWYVLDADGHPQHIQSGLEWETWQDAHPEERLLQQEDVQLGDRTFWVSTVFLGRDYGHCRGEDPVLWETMVFERQTETSHLTKYDRKLDERGQPVYTYTTDKYGTFRHPEFEEVQLPVGAVCYDELYVDRYSSRQAALEGHKKAVQWVLDGLAEDSDDED